MRRLRFSLVLVPLLLGGSESAHALVERTAPSDYEGAELFRHGALGPHLLPIVVAGGLAVLFGGLAAVALGRDDRRHRLRLPLWPVAVLPLVVFAVQEYVEYWAGNGHVEWALAGERPFLAGLLLQLPFALAALVASRLLFRLAGAIARRRFPAVARRGAARREPVPRSQALPRISVHAARRLTRGPPLASSS